MGIQEAASEFEKLVNGAPPMGFMESLIEKLPDPAAFIVARVLEPYKIKWTVGSVIVQNHVCFKIEDSMAHYLIVGPQNFMWCTEGLHDSIHPDQFLIHLFKEYQGLDIKIMGDRTAILEKDGEKFYVPHLK